MILTAYQACANVYKSLESFFSVAKYSVLIPVTASVEYEVFAHDVESAIKLASKQSKKVSIKAEENEKDKGKDVTLLGVYEFDSHKEIVSGNHFQGILNEIDAVEIS